MLLRTDPFRDLDRLTETVFGTTARPAPMPVDAYRDQDTFVVHLDLPGVDPSSIELTVQRNVLTVRAERKRPADNENTERVIAETTYGVFARQLFLGDTLDADRLQATYDAGVLTLRIPVSDKAKPRRIPVNTATGSSPQEIRSPHEE